MLETAHRAPCAVSRSGRDRWGRRVSSRRRDDMAGAITRGVLFVHSAPRALCPHVEWAAGGVLGSRLSLDWIPQPASRGLYRAEYSWQGIAGTGARLTSALRGWAHLRYEVTEEPSHGTDGARGPDPRRAVPSRRRFADARGAGAGGRPGLGRRARAVPLCGRWSARIAE